MIFEKKGKENTEKVIELAVAYAVNHKIENIVIASKTGYTTEKMIDFLSHKNIKNINIVDVTHCYGDNKQGQCEMSLEKRTELQKKGVSIITATHALSGAEDGIIECFGGATPVKIIAQTLKMLGQGMKVAVECSTMALDAGAIPLGEEIISIAGCNQGADEAISIIPAYSKKIFDTKIIDIICKPRIS